jgi:hypothetical protein
MAKLFEKPENLPSIGVQKIGTKTRVAIITLNPPRGKYELLPYDEIMKIYRTVKNKTFS